jgi:hypothetical protein
MENQPQSFNIENSPIKEAYKLLGANTPLELSNLYTAEDQRLMNSHEWDYNNPDLITNKIKEIIEVADKSQMTEDEKEWSEDIVWFWYHHAISTAFYRNKDREMAKKFAAKAMEIQPENEKNTITKVLYLLVNDRVAEAEEFAATIKGGKLDDGTENPEPQTAKDLIEEYKKGMI